jgi:DNA-binding transcriptional regulator YdaS (Cro superfamily)
MTTRFELQAENNRIKKKYAKQLHKAALRVMDLFGGCPQMVKALNAVGDKVYQQIVWQWVMRHKCIPEKHIRFIVKALKGQITAEEIRPDLFDF